MHSDGAAKSWVDPATDKTLNDRMDAACAAERPDRALHALARALRDEGLSQQELYALFESHRARRTDDADESAFDGLCDAMDFICGWHGPNSPGKLFETNSLPQAQARAREWEDVRTQREAEAAEAAGGEGAGIAALGSSWQAWASVLALALALAAAHGAVAMLLSLLHPES